MESLTCACPSRHLQQPVHGGGQEQSEAEPQHWWQRADCGGADPWTRGVLWPDTGSAQRCVVLNSYSFILVRFGCFLTPLFAAGYWPSYNIPFHRKIYELSGYTEMWQQYGDDFSYDLCPRAKIFRRDQASVIDLGSLKHIMRFNGEGLSLCLVSQWTNSLKHNRIFVSWLTQLLFLDQLPLPGAGWSFVLHVPQMFLFAYFQTTRRIRTPKATPASPSAAVATWGQRGQHQKAVTILRYGGTP